jgi:hypothetical protein
MRDDTSHLIKQPTATLHYAFGVALARMLGDAAKKCVAH